tara:strand:- start:105 stop:320 length:216 start_codon:yes stop_codon:yes gene_type:complete
MKQIKKEEIEWQKELERIKAKYFEKAKAKTINFSIEELVKKIAELEFALDSMNDSWTGIGEWAYIGERMYD